VIAGNWGITLNGSPGGANNTCGHTRRRIRPIHSAVTAVPLHSAVFGQIQSVAMLSLADSSNTCTVYPEYASANRAWDTCHRISMVLAFSKIRCLCICMSLVREGIFAA
jgi:hypothetical protein